MYSLVILYFLFLIITKSCNSHLSKVKFNEVEKMYLESHLDINTIVKNLKKEKLQELSENCRFHESSSLLCKSVKPKEVMISKLGPKVISKHKQWPTFDCLELHPRDSRRSFHIQHCHVLF